MAGWKTWRVEKLFGRMAEKATAEKPLLFTVKVYGMRGPIPLRGNSLVRRLGILKGFA